MTLCYMETFLPQGREVSFFVSWPLDSRAMKVEGGEHAACGTGYVVEER